MVDPHADQNGTYQWRARLHNSGHTLTIVRENEATLREAVVPYLTLGWEPAFEKRVVGPWIPVEADEDQAQ
jgi:hypothetical protein